MRPWVLTLFCASVCTYERWELKSWTLFGLTRSVQIEALFPAHGKSRLDMWHTCVFCSRLRHAPERGQRPSLGTCLSRTQDMLRAFFEGGGEGASISVPFSVVPYKCLPSSFFSFFSTSMSFITASFPVFTPFAAYSSRSSFLCLASSLTYPSNPIHPLCLARTYHPSSSLFYTCHPATMPLYPLPLYLPTTPCPLAPSHTHSNHPISSTPFASVLLLLIVISEAADYAPTAPASPPQFLRTGESKYRQQLQQQQRRRGAEPTRDPNGASTAGSAGIFGTACGESARGGIG